jgi:elongation factor 1-alpha
MDELAFVVCGSVDSGKSTLIGTLLSGKLDNGNGLNRAIVSKHNHEVTTGRTSSISVHSIKKFNNNKSVIFIDLCGHEKYLKTTLYGIMGYYPDYAIILISANRGILKMTREHIKILHHLKIPIILVLTKIDIMDKVYAGTESVENVSGINNETNKKNNENKDTASSGIISQTVNNIKRIFNKGNYLVVDMLEEFSDTYNVDNICLNRIPLFKISCKTGYGLEQFKNYISKLPKYHNIKLNSEVLTRIPQKINSKIKVPINVNKKISNDDFIFYVEKIYCPPGIGWVVTGLLKCANAETFITSNTQLYLGPYNEVIQVKIWSIRDYYNEKIDKLYNSQRGCLAIRCDKKLNSNILRKGCLLTNNIDIINNASYNYKAVIKLLNHPTNVKDNFSPVIHCSTIRQTASIKIIEIRDNENIRSTQVSENENKEELNQKCIYPGNTAIIHIQFKYYPEIIEPDQVFFLREGLTLGVGTILEKICV